MIITLRKRQLTYEQRKELITAILAYGLSCVCAVARHLQCSENTVWNIWSRYKQGGRKIEAILPRVRCPKNPNEHTQSERDLLVAVLNDNPDVNYTTIYTKLCHRGYKRSYKGMWGYISKHNLRDKRHKAEYVPKVYGVFQIPPMFGFKWQLDVKFVECNRIDGKAYQYTMIDEATRRCFEMAFREHSTYSTKHFIIAAIRHFGYKPVAIQTDNGSEFTNRYLTDDPQKQYNNLVDNFLREKNIIHKLIPPACPIKNCIVERRHREDERQYKHKGMFNGLQELNSHLQEWCADKDDTFTFALCKKCHKSPNMRQAELLQELKRFAINDLHLTRKVTLQELIYAYCEWERIKAERQLIPPKYIFHLPDGVTLQEDIKFALTKK